MVGKTYKSKHLIDDNKAPIWLCVDSDKTKDCFVLREIEDGNNKLEVLRVMLYSDFVEYEEAVPTLPRGNACYHVWKQYIGFTEAYEFCGLCNLKRVM
jgi:hypothetical protein